MKLSNTFKHATDRGLIRAEVENRMMQESSAKGVVFNPADHKEAIDAEVALSETPKLSNTFKHLRIGMLAGIIMLFLMIALIPDRAKEIVGWTAIVVWFCGTVLWEAWQWVKNGQKPNYWEFRGWDTVCDLLAGNIPFVLLTVIAMYGHYAGNVMRP